MKKIDRYEGEFAFLSNDWPREVVYSGARYRSVQAALDAAAMIDDQPRPGWEEVRDIVARKLLRQKFEHPDLRSKLLATRDAEINGTFGGVIMQIREDLAKRGSGALYTSLLSCDMDLMGDMLRRARISHTWGVDLQGYYLSIKMGECCLFIEFNSDGRLVQFQNFSESVEKSVG